MSDFGSTVAGEGMAQRCARMLCDCIANCNSCWEGDPAYKELLYKLELCREECDWILASPGRRAVLRSALPNHSGQEPSFRHSEPPMEVQRSYGA